MLRDEERWEKWEISLEKREKQHTGVVSFPGLAPDTDGLKEQHRQSHPGGTRCPTGHQCTSCSRENLARDGKVKLYPRGLSGAATAWDLGVWDSSAAACCALA